MTRALTLTVLLYRMIKADPATAGRGVSLCLWLFGEEMLKNRLDCYWIHDRIWFDDRVWAHNHGRLFLGQTSQSISFRPTTATGTILAFQKTPSSGGGQSEW